MNYNNIALKMLTTLTFLCMGSASEATSKTGVFVCKFGAEFSFVITVNGTEKWSRIGTSIGTGSKAKGHFDKVTGAWIFVEYDDDGRPPSTLTTILSGGDAWHSRHTLSIEGSFLAYQMQGKCAYTENTAE